MTPALSRDMEMDLASLVQEMGTRIENALFLSLRGSGRTEADVGALAGLLACAVSAQALRSAFSIPAETWAACNRIAQDPNSLTSALPVLPRTAALETRLFAQALTKKLNG